MNLRYVLAICGFILVLVNLVADEGGPLDAFTGGSSSTIEGPTTGEPQRVAAAHPSVSSGTTFASGSDVGIGDYQFDDGGYDPTPPPPVPSAGSSHTGVPWSIATGALTDEQLGVEKATGLAPVIIEGA